MLRVVLLTSLLLLQVINSVALIRHGTTLASVMHHQHAIQHTRHPAVKLQSPQLQLPPDKVIAREDREVEDSIGETGFSYAKFARDRPFGMCHDTRP